MYSNSQTRCKLYIITPNLRLSLNPKQKLKNLYLGACSKESKENQSFRRSGTDHMNNELRANRLVSSADAKPDSVAVMPLKRVELKLKAMIRILRGNETCFLLSNLRLVWQASALSR